MSTTIPDDLVSIPYAARVANLHHCTIRRWIVAGKLTAYGRQQSYRVSLSEVLPEAKLRRTARYYSPDGRAPAFRPTPEPSGSR